MDEVSSPPARPVEKACEEPALRARGGGGSGQEGFRNRRLLSERQPARPRAAGRGAGELLQSARRRRPGAGLDRACLRGTPHPRRLPRLLQRIRRRFPSRRQGRAQRLSPPGRRREKGRPFWAIPGSLYEQTSPRHSRGLSLYKKRGPSLVKDGPRFAVVVNSNHRLCLWGRGRAEATRGKRPPMQKQARATRRGQKIISTAERVP